MKKTILCIDDVQTNLLLIQSLIEDLAGDKYKVLIAQSAKDGLSMLEKYHVDLILLDIVMPDIDGLEAASMIRANDRTKDIPIIFVTAKKDDETIGKCYSIGGDDYVNKPFNNIELISRISFHIESKEKDKLLMLEKQYAQNVLDLQDNLIFVAKHGEIVSVNKSLLNFFEVEDIEGLRQKHNCFSEAFARDSDYFNVEQISSKEEWLDEVVELSKNEDVLVKMVKNDRAYVYNIKVKPINDQYIVSMTDITLASQQTLEYKHDANYDSLTNIYNRNMLTRLLDIKIITSNTNGSVFSLVIMDIDHFKDVNDTHGHLVGDDILVSLSKLVSSSIRDGDLFARWGGEEFILIFDVNAQKCKPIIENIRKAIENEKFDVVGKLTCSFGVSDFQPNDTIESLVKRADDALYEAKEGGRNRVYINS